MDGGVMIRSCWVNFRLAYEQRARNVSEQTGAAAGSGFLLPTTRAPHRVRQLDASLVSVGSTYSYRHEIDRAFAAFHIGNAEVTAGRQVIGWGRGLFFGAVDLFAPFTPLESDREWRRGIDAIRSSIPLTDLISLDSLFVAGSSLDESAYAVRLQGYMGDIDGEVMFGRRADDCFGAVSSSRPLFGAEVYGELSVFRTDDGAAQGRGDTVVKTVLGSSYSLNLYRQILIAGEYH